MRLPPSPILSGVVVGVLTSLPDAVITNAAAPIMITGVMFGAVAGWIVGRMGPTRTDYAMTAGSAPGPLSVTK